MFNKILKKSYSIVLVCSIIVGLIPADITTRNLLASESNLGQLSNYNVIARNNFTATQADSEGAIAVGGNLHAPSKQQHHYTIGAAHPDFNGQHIGQIFIPDQNPALLLAGNYKNSGTGLLVKGNVVKATETNLSTKDISVDGTIASTTKSTITKKINTMISEAQKYLSKALNFTLGLVIDGGSGYNSSKISFHLAKEDSSVDIGIVEAKNDVSQIGELYAPKNSLSQEAIIIYSPAKIINFIPGAIIYNGKIVDTNTLYHENSIFEAIASKTLYYFPNAVEVNLNNNAVIGSVFAPAANFKATGGAINGQAIFNNIEKDGGFEFHNFKFNWQRKLETGKVKIKKYITGTQTPLTGASFVLKDINGIEFGHYTTNENGEIIIENIPFGEYIITETVSPPGYQNNYENSHIIIDENNAEYNIVAYNTPILGQIEILKLDRNSHIPLSGATFGLKNENGQIITSSQTDQHGLAFFSDVPYGDYLLFEMVTPEGYKLLEGSIKVSISGNQTLSFTAYNELLSPGKLEIIKVDGQNQTIKLRDAHYRLTHLDSKESIVIISNDEGLAQIDGLAYGKYSVEEIKAPDGYFIDTTIYFIDISENMKTIKYTHNNFNSYNDDPLLGSFKLQKKDIYNNQILLEHAEFELKHLDSGTIYHLKTDNRGELFQQRLPLGSYEIRETKAPPGYLINDKVISFNLNTHLLNIEYTFENSKINDLGQVTIFKEDAQNSALPLAGAEFQLTHLPTGETFALVSNQNGIASIESLPLGAYALIETKAPPGYILNPNFEYFELTDSFFTYQTTFTNKKQDKQLIVEKFDISSSDIKLEGVRFRLEAPDGTHISTQVTDAWGRAFFPNIHEDLNEVYLIEELAAKDYQHHSQNRILVDISNSESNIFYTRVPNTLKSSALDLQKIVLDADPNVDYQLDKIKIALYGNSIYNEYYLDNAGNLVVDNLTPGTYFIKEVEVPSMMYINEIIYKIDILAGTTTLFELENEIANEEIDFDIGDQLLDLWLVKEDQNETRLNGIPFELFMQTLEGQTISLGIQNTKGQFINGYFEDGVALWTDLSLNDFFNDAMEKKFSRLYVIERKTTIYPDIIQNLTKEIEMNLSFNLDMFFQKSSIKINDPENLNGNIINYRTEPYVLNKTLVRTGQHLKRRLLIGSVILFGSSYAFKKGSHK